MTRRLPAIAAALLAAAGCSRTQQPRDPQPAPEEAPAGRGAGAGVPPAPGRPRVPASPEALLRDGAIAEVQRALVDRGLLKAHRAGRLDDATSAALLRFQGERGLAATGFPDRETLKGLGLDPERVYVEEADRERTKGR